MARITTLAEAIADHVHDGDAVALEGFTHLIPYAAGHEIIRQQRRDLTLVRLTPDVLYDQMIGMGTTRKLVFSWGGNPGVGSLHRFRDAVENGWPRPLELEEHSHAGMANRYVAGASRLPFAVLRGYTGTDLPAHTTNVAAVTCPFTGEELTAVAALRPDVTIIHAQQADRSGNVQLWGITGVQKEAVLAADRAVATVEELVDALEPQPGAVVLPSWVVDAVVEAPGGAHPSYAHGYSDRDNAFYEAWDPISRDRTSFGAWIQAHVLDPPPDPTLNGAPPMAIATQTMTDEQRKSVAVEYLKAFDNGGATSTGGNILDLFAEDAQVYFPKWGLASGKAEIGKLFGDVGATINQIAHHYSQFNWVFSGSDVVVCEGTSHGEHQDGPWRAGVPEWGAGRWCDVFEIRDFLIQRVFIYLDPDYAGRDTTRYPWLGTP